ncbi:hypothetical protein M758_11G085900 [Ceratodon purpureus]|nr:hypothetical protein M758_11G085900 [Ceratodon purpureus]
MILRWNCCGLEYFQSLFPSSNEEAGGPSNPTSSESSSKKEAGGPSNPTSSNSEGADPINDCDDDSGPVLEPKHDIFLSHSGKQKDFTEHLEKELKRWGYTTFFDVRNDSIPNGTKFPEHIFSAASQCPVAILILSEDFFTNSKWPMLELAAFVDAQNKSREMGLPERPFILPVYFRLSWYECTEDKKRRSRWLSTWKKWEKLPAEKGIPPINVHKWELALKDVLRNTGGPAYKQSSREAGLIDEVVKAVRHLLPPPKFSSDARIRGKRRICKTIMEKILNTTASSNGARVVGLYGMGGTGKTTFCKELCYLNYREFEGKVCYAELGSKSESELKKDVVGTLTDVTRGSLSEVDDSKVTEHLQKRMAGEKVFLALDNVWPKSEEEAMVYVRGAKYGPNSIVLVTARSIDILKSLQIDESDCLEMPELEEEDARQLFLDCAAPGSQSQFQRNKDKYWSIKYFIERCRFSKGGSPGVHFHPLALRVLGLQLKSDVGCNPEKWVKSLKDGSKFDQDRQKADSLFPILGRGYDLLTKSPGIDDRLLFMDVIFFNPDRFSYGTVTLFEWLSMVHGTDMASIMKRLQGLKARALLEDIGIGVGRVIVHDLYREFARYETNRGELEDRTVIWHAGRVVYTPEFEKTPPSGPDGCWSKVERVCVDCPAINVEGVKWQHFANVVVIVLGRIEKEQVLDLRGLRRLRSLTLEGSYITVNGLGELRNLRWLDLEGIRCGHHEIGHLTVLQVLRVNTYCRPRRWWWESQSLELANLDKCINLRYLEVRCACLKALPDLSQMTSLRRAIFECPNATDGPVMGLRMCALQELQLVNCRSLCRLPRLGEAGLLQVLKITNDQFHYRNNKVEQFPEIRTLTRLRKLEIGPLNKLLQLPELGELVALEELVLVGLWKVRQLPDMFMLTQLRELELVHIAEHLREQPGWVSVLPSQLRYLSKIYNCSTCHEVPNFREYPIYLCGIRLHHKPPVLYNVEHWESREGKESAILNVVSRVGYTGSVSRIRCAYQTSETWAAMGCVSRIRCAYQTSETWAAMGCGGLGMGSECCEARARPREFPCSH